MDATEEGENAMTHPSFIHFTRGLKVLVSILCVLTMAASGAGVQSVIAASVAEQAAGLNKEITFEDGSLTGPKSARSVGHASPSDPRLHARLRRAL